MPAVTELDLPRFDYTDPEMRGERYRAAMRDLEGRGWLAGLDLPGGMRSGELVS
jgi:hypothetical protein